MNVRSKPMAISGVQQPERAGLASRLHPAGTFAGNVGGFSLDQIFAILRRRFRIIVLVALGGTVLAVAASYMITPLYQATASVAVDASDPNVSGIVDNPQLRQGSLETVATKIEVINSRQLTEEVMVKLQLYQDPFFNPPPSALARLLQMLASFLPQDWLVYAGLPANAGTSDPKEAAIERFKRYLTVVQPAGTNAIQISYLSNTPAKTAGIANALAEAYIRWEAEHRQETAREAAAWLQQRLGDLGARVQQAEQAAADFRIKHDLAATNTDAKTITDQRLVDLKNQLVALQGEEIDKQAKLERARAARSSGNGADALALSDAYKSPILLQLYQQEADLNRREAELKQVFGNRHPQILDAQVQINDVKQRIQLEVNRAIANMQDDLASLKSREKAIGRDISSLQAGSSQDRQAEVQLGELERQAKTSRDLYEQLLNRYHEAQERADLLSTKAQVVSRAAPPAQQSTPGKAVFAVLGFTVSTMLGSMMAFLVEQLDRRVQNVRQLEHLLGIRALGILPFIRQRRFRKRPASYIAEQPFTYFAEASQSILMQLDSSADPSRLKVLVVTSALPDEGKTTFALSLAATGVRSGFKVCVVDLDLPHPSVPGKLGFGLPRPGLTDYVAGTAELADVIHRDNKSAIDFIPVGERPENSLMLLRSPALDSLWRMLRANYDLVVVDSAPLLALSETQAVGRFADHVVIAAQWRRTEAAATAEATRLLSEFGVRSIRFVLTKVDIKKYKLYAAGESG